MASLAKVTLMVFAIATPILGLPALYPDRSRTPEKQYGLDLQVSEASDPVEVLLYRTLMKQQAEKLQKQKEQALANAIEDPNSPSDEVLAQLKALQSAGIGKEEGRWLDQIVDVADLLPPNYHNASEYRTEIGNENVDVKQSIDRASDGNSDSLWLSDAVDVEPERRSSHFDCSVAHPCESYEYCYETDYGSECRACVVTGAECEEDAQCCSSGHSNNFCVRGRCRQAAHGSAGTICAVSEDCNAGLCCAQDIKFRHRICKPYARPGQRCSNRVETVQDFMILEDTDFFCPCEKGLTCSEKDVVVYAVVPMKYDEGMFCTVPEAEDPNWLDETDLISWPSTGLKPNLWNTLRQPRLETEDDQRFEELLPLLHKDSKKAIENPADGPDM